MEVRVCVDMDGWEWWWASAGRKMKKGKKKGKKEERKGKTENAFEARREMLFVWVK